MQLAVSLQLRQHAALLWGNQQCHCGGQLPLIFFGGCLAGIGVISGGGSDTDDLYIFKFGWNNGLALFFEIRSHHGNNISALQLAGQTSGKTLDGDGHGLLASIQIVQVGVVSGRFVRYLGVDDIVARNQVSGGKLSHGIFLQADYIFRQVIAAYFYSLHHIGSDLLTSQNGLSYPDDLFFLADTPIEKRRHTKADYQREQDADNADNGSIFEQTHNWQVLLSHDLLWEWRKECPPGQALVHLQRRRLRSPEIRIAAAPKGKAMPVMVRMTVLFSFFIAFLHNSKCK